MNLPNQDIESSATPDPSWRKRFPELRQLVGCYLFQGWTEMYETAEEAIGDGIASCYSDDRLSATVAELDDLRSLGLGDEELEDLFLYELGRDYNVAADGLTNTRWLEEVTTQLREALQARRGT